MIHGTAAVTDTPTPTTTDVHRGAVVDGCEIGKSVEIWRYANLYGCSIGDESMVGTYTEIQSDATVGDRCWVQSHSFVCSGVTIGNDVFVSHGVAFTNDVYPPSDESEWKDTVVGDGAVIGTNATLIPVEIGENAMVGAGAVVTEDVPPGTIVAGNPAEVIGEVSDT